MHNLFQRGLSTYMHISEVSLLVRTTTKAYIGWLH